MYKKWAIMDNSRMLKIEIHEAKLTVKRQARSNKAQ